MLRTSIATCIVQASQGDLSSSPKPLAYNLALVERLVRHPSRLRLPCTPPRYTARPGPPPASAGGPQASSLHARRPRVPLHSRAPPTEYPRRPDPGRRSDIATLSRASTTLGYSPSRPQRPVPPASTLRRSSAAACLFVSSGIPHYGRLAMGPRNSTHILVSSDYPSRPDGLGLRDRRHGHAMGSHAKERRSE